ncbi:MAG: NUDIX domain-containing protein [Gammaproteobacteria bacterium]|jgi:ADP-ribose pyrophosphatase|nr:NUDIX domain-containing protein [Gammaproteobacteria bacterium]
MSANMKWSAIKKNIRYKGFFKLTEVELQHDLFAGGKTPVLVREIIDRGHAVAVLPYDPVRDEVVLIEQFRIGAGEDSEGPWLIEVIAGYQEPGESAEEVVHREALEEAGCLLSDVELMYSCYSSPGGSNERVSLFFARTDSSNIGGIHGLDEEGEDIRVHVLSSQQAFDWLDSGRIDSAMPIISMQWFRINRERIRQRWL